MDIKGLSRKSVKTDGWTPNQPSRLKKFSRSLQIGAECYLFSELDDNHRAKTLIYLVRVHYNNGMLIFTRCEVAV